MLQTPPSFTPLHTRPGHPATHRFVFRGNELLLREADLALPDVEATVLAGAVHDQAVPVGLLGDQYCEASSLGADAVAPASHAFMPLRSLFGAMDETRLAVAGRAFQLVEWARTHRYCGACGAGMAQVSGERCMRCTVCGHHAYPRISPAMMVLIRRGRDVLLARHAAHANARFTALAGFLEAGESIEDAVHREVREEVGLTVGDLRYFGSQSWPFPHSLMIAFTAEYVGGEISVDPAEITEARWFGPGDMFPEVPGRFSIARALIDAHRPE